MLVFICGAAVSAALAFAAARRFGTHNEIILDILAVVLPLSEIWKQLLLTWEGGGAYQWWYLPFQLCSMPLYLLPARQILIHLGNREIPAECPVASFQGGISKYSGAVRLISDFLTDFGLLGGLFAFADQSGMHYRLRVLTVHSYLWHFTMIFLGLYLIFSGRHSRTYRSYLRPAALFLVLAAGAEMINALCHHFGEINMFYISPWEPVTQIILRDIASYIGIPAEIALYLILILTGGFLIHAAASVYDSR